MYMGALYTACLPACSPTCVVHLYTALHCTELGRWQTPLNAIFYKRMGDRHFIILLVGASFGLLHSTVQSIQRIGRDRN